MDGARFAWVAGSVAVACSVGAAAAPGEIPRQNLTRGMVYIPAGEFIMGTSPEEARRLAREYRIHPGLFLLEAPRRKLSLPAFWIDRFPVTRAQYQSFARATGRRIPWGDDLTPEQAEHPATGMTWDEAAAYAEWAGKRLPTAEEWEKAARGTDGRLYPWGNRWRSDATRIHDPRSPRTEPLTTPVGCFPRGASPYGVQDLCGNAAEWTTTPARPPVPELGWAWYVVKGASAAQSLRCHFRCAARALSAHQSRVHPWLGFRCALDAQGPPPAAEAPPPPRKAPAPPIATGPLVERYLKEPIRISPGPSIRVPYFPDSSFGMSLPEQIGAEDLPLGWSMPSSRTPWHVDEDGTRAGYEATWSDTAIMRVSMRAGLDVVDFTLSLRNLTDRPFTQVHSNSCFQGWLSPFFEDAEEARTYVFTDAGPTCALLMPPFDPGEPLHRGWNVAGKDQAAHVGGERVRLPIMATVSNDGRWVIAQAYAEGVSVAGNAHYSCLHVRPRWPDIPPGDERAVTGKLYFLRGSLDDLVARWRRDFRR